MVSGLGPSKVKDLMSKKITSVKKLRKAVKDGKVTLPSHALIGLKHYEDFLERIPREETKDFFEKIQKIAKKIDPNLILKVTGSYRRKLETSGDIDILMTHSLIKTKSDIKKSNLLKDLIKELEENEIVTDILSLQKEKFMGVIQSNSKIKNKVQKKKYEKKKVLKKSMKKKF